LARVKHQRSIVARLEAKNVRAYFDWAVEPTADPFQTRPPYGWKPLRWLFGEDAFSTIVEVDSSIDSTWTDDDVESLAELPALRKVGLNGPRLTDRSISTLKKLPNLQTVALQDIELTADGLAELATHPKLVSLILIGSQVNDAAFAGLESPSQLEQLQLFHTAVTSAGLKHLEKLHRLRYLEIYDAARIDDEGLHSIGKLTSLSELQFRDIPLTDKSFTELSSLANLERLSIQNGSTVDSTHVDAGSQGLTRLKKLTSLQLEGVDLGDAGVSALCELTQLESLNLARSRITDSSAPLLAKLKNLNDLSIDHTELTDAGFGQLTTLLKVERISCGPHISESAARELRRSLPDCSITCIDARGREEPVR
jgi:hypothetical protein